MDLLGAAAFTLKQAVVPPLSLILLGLAGVVVYRWRPRLGKGLVLSAGLLASLLSLPIVSSALMAGLQPHPILDLERLDHGAGAIIILGADFVPDAPEFDKPSIGPVSLERVRYAATLAKASGLPVLTSGGVLVAGYPSVAEAMADVLESEFGVAVRWKEGDSNDTEGNARFSARLLERAGIERAYLVSHAWHLPRAAAAFEAAGLSVVPAPTSPRTWPDWWLTAVLPSARSFQESSFAVHEWIGRVWYALRRALG